MEVNASKRVRTSSHQSCDHGPQPLADCVQQQVLDHVCLAAARSSVDNFSSGGGGGIWPKLLAVFVNGTNPYVEGCPLLLMRRITLSLKPSKAFQRVPGYRCSLIRGQQRFSRRYLNILGQSLHDRIDLVGPLGTTKSLQLFVLTIKCFGEKARRKL